ncbi:potassium channel family protein [Natranaerobius thermophilus]|uniref:TrkA-N domain protein n=1 Tax=Natranaerobius thermophilus (strain ATCC BAA-1301 / DSM 18059 / JW/NM-WN-LF) TaxID=457570 RepID=B2A3S7_NATTJ|nr:TrkA family potassium uptake protein [Natranaerobius thermophilus]ACB83703.1 TrkA-N domain protein [Natranaerobius thermophilus JW/NM-WN-LF]
MAKKKQFAILGLGRFGSSVAYTLTNMGYDVLAVDSNEERVEEVSKEVTHAVQANVTSEKNLQALGIRNFDVVIVAIGEDIQASIMATILVKDMGVEHVVVKSQDKMHGEVLKRIGADRVIFPEWDMGCRVAHNLATTNILDYIELSPEYSLAEVSVPTKMVGKTPQELDLRAKYGVTVLAIKRGNDINISPKANAQFHKSDVLIVVGKQGDINRLEELNS